MQEKLYADAKFDAISELRQAFVTLYKAIWNFFVKFVRTQNEHRMRKIVKQSLSAKDRFGPHLKQLREQRKSITAYASQVNREEQLCQSYQLSRLQELLIDLESPIIRTEIMAMEVVQILSHQEHEKLLDWVSCIPYPQHFQQAKEKALAGTGAWFFKHSQYVDWHNSSTSRMLWLHGMPGSGKSTLR